MEAETKDFFVFSYLDAMKMEYVCLGDLIVASPGRNFRIFEKSTGKFHTFACPKNTTLFQWQGQEIPIRYKDDNTCYSLLSAMNEHYSGLDTPVTNNVIDIIPWLMGFCRLVMLMTGGYHDAPIPFPFLIQYMAKKLTEFHTIKDLWQYMKAVTLMFTSDTQNDDKFKMVRGLGFHVLDYMEHFDPEAFAENEEAIALFFVKQEFAKVQLFKYLSSSTLQSMKASSKEALISSAIDTILQDTSIFETGHAWDWLLTVAFAEDS